MRGLKHYQINEVNKVILITLYNSENKSYKEYMHNCRRFEFILNLFYFFY